MFWTGLWSALIPTAKRAKVDAVIASPSAYVGGAIDAAGFRDVDGRRYVVYKMDVNSVGSDGSCNNGNSPQRSTPIMLATIEPDGITPRDPPIQILDRGSSDGPFVEAPSLYRTPDGQYILFFSSNCYSSTAYDVTWTIAPKITGPYTKAGPLL